jgi:hypothetical protein
LTCSNELFGPETVAVQKLTTEEPRHRLQANVGMRRDINRSIRRERKRSHVIGETPRADGAPTPGGKGTTNGELSHRRLATWGDFDVVHQHGLMLTTTTVKSPPDPVNRPRKRVQYEQSCVPVRKSEPAIYFDL